MRTLFLLFFPFCVHSQLITTYAGNGIAGSTTSGDGGPAINTQIETPWGLNFDNSGNLLICQADLVRKVDKVTNIITTIAGSDTATNGSWTDNCSATCAFILAPFDICLDLAGNYYIADHWYSEIRKVSISTGIIDTFAGNRTPGSVGNGGPAKSAELNDPIGLCFDPPQHYLYISNEFGYAVRKVNMLTDTITAFAGTGVNGYNGDGGPATNAKFSRVLGIVSDTAGNIYIGDWDNARIRKVDAVTGIVNTIVGNGTVGNSGDGSPATNAMIDRPAGLCFDKCGNLYFSEEDSNRVRRVDAVSGIITTVAGNGIAGYNGDSIPAVNAELYNPVGVAIDSSGNLYIGDQGNNRVRKVTIPPTVGTPTITITSSAGGTLSSTGIIDTFSATATISGLSPYSYQWYVNGVIVSGSTNSTYIYSPANGDSISCVFMVTTPCTGAITANSNSIHIIIPPLSVLGNLSTQSLSIYPNPVNDVLHMDGQGQAYRILSIVGVTLLQGTLQQGSNSISIQALPGGMYIVEVAGSDGGKTIAKIIKQ